MKLVSALRGIVTLAPLLLVHIFSGCGDGGSSSSTTTTTTSGGGPSSEVLFDHCTKKAACDGGNAKDIKACVASIEGARGEAAAYGCEESYDALTECLVAKSTCKQMLYGADCSTEQDAVNKCEAAAAGG